MKHERSVSLSVAALSWPIFIEIFLQMLIGNVDQLMMSQYSQSAVAAVANANQVMNIIILLLTVMSTATTILVAQYLGAEDRHKIGEVCTVSLFFNGLFSVAAAMGLFIFDREIFQWMDLPPELLDEATLYLRIISFAIPIQGLYFALVATFRGHSQPKITMFVALVMNVFHIFIDYILIFGWGFIPSLGVLGVAVATNISKTFGFGLLVWLFYRKLNVRVSWSYLRPFPWPTLKQLLHISVPAGGETLSYQVSQTTILKMVNIFGLAVITTRVYVTIIAMFCYVYTQAISAAAQIIVGFLIGADREDEVSCRVWRTVALGIVVSTSLSMFFYLTSDYIFPLFTNNPEVAALGKKVLLVEFFLEIGRSVNIVMVQCLQAAGDIRTPMIVGIFGMWMLAVPLSYLFGIVWDWGLVGIWIAMAVDEGVRALIFVYRWQSGKWKDHKLIERRSRQVEA